MSREEVWDFYPKPLEACKQENDLSYVFESSLGCWVENELWERKSGSSETN